MNNKIYKAITEPKDLLLNIMIGVGIVVLVIFGIMVFTEHYYGIILGMAVGGLLVLAGLCGAMIYRIIIDMVNEWRFNELFGDDK